MQGYTVVTAQCKGMLPNAPRLQHSCQLAASSIWVAAAQAQF